MALPYVLARRSLAFGRRVSLVLLVANVLLGALLVAQGCLSAAVGDVRHVMLGILCLVAGIAVVAVEFVHVAALRAHAAFLFSFCGRGLLYLVLGCLSVDSAPAALGCGLALVVAGAAFLALTPVRSLSFDDPSDRYAAIVRGPPGADSDAQAHAAAGPSPPQPKTVLQMGISAPLGASSCTLETTRSALMFHSPFGSSTDRPRQA
ncbi:hypothetical protein H4R18_003320 [Coemansia javaensis]|uniref:COPI associated protein n=1 Tax=Coemansia javaensis TaxID=2761396 RepID=A0A9W8H8A9_9FUNG|nr:hypothetical protein H4R18_003320 [Coemansia javaensis]